MEGWLVDDKNFYVGVASNLMWDQGRGLLTRRNVRPIRCAGRACT